MIISVEDKLGVSGLASFDFQLNENEARRWVYSRMDPTTNNGIVDELMVYMWRRYASSLLLLFVRGLGWFGVLVVYSVLDMVKMASEVR